MNFSWLLSSRNCFSRQKDMTNLLSNRKSSRWNTRCPLITAFGVALPHLPSWERQKYSSQVMEKGKWFPAQSWGLKWEVGLTGVLHWNSFGHTPDLTVSSLREAHKWKTFSGENLKFRVYDGKEVIVPELGEDRFMEEMAAILKKNSKVNQGFLEASVQRIMDLLCAVQKLWWSMSLSTSNAHFFSNMHRCPHTGHTITLFNSLRFNLSLN